jgi:hypothetical protein
MNIFALIVHAIRKLLNKLEGPLTEAEVDAKFVDLASKSSEKLDDWKESIVDMLKLLQMDSSLQARKQLAAELGYHGDLDGSAAMNIWLAKEVRKRVASGDLDSLK